MTEEDKGKLIEELKVSAKKLLIGEPSPNLLIYRIRQENKTWNEKIKNENLPLKENSFNFFMKKVLTETEGAEEYTRAAYYL